ncbi:hypothetical protein IFO69_02925 [Echinicola sp. CAU 1574]|uniref:SbsA Ig-like domain-containing protein n=1 Tax=Echinicola arenosa TaxID=2774144 RepID=A0ABR9AFR6_9BACT|nr:Ig-like domain-containing protein [Echinicola arenosa]MBD8487694.1 hypothetical protein [Echinicola arenosa]
MNKLFTLLTAVLVLASCQTEKKHFENIVTIDITHFWEAYDKITSTQDPILQYKYLDSLYLQRGTEGLNAIRQVRNYTPEDYIRVINAYPKFWTSIRENTLKIDQFSSELQDGIEKFREIYPELKPAKIYFTIGAFRTGGTTLDSLVLIGSELALTDKSSVSKEFPEEEREDRRTFFDSNPIDNLVLLNIHEYVHTQQKPMVHNMLSLAIYEGVAEFVSVKAMGVPSAAPAIEFGKKNADVVREKFEKEMFYPNNRFKWLWDRGSSNEFGVRDLAYYIGYQMAENHYEKSENKKEAIKKLIELDFNNESEIEEFVESTGFFSSSLEELYQKFDNKRPSVIGIKQFKNNSNNVSPKINQITVEFSEPLNGINTGLDVGPLGKDYLPKISPNNRVFSEDNKSWTINVELEPNKHYQIQLENNFRTNDWIPLKPYLIEFKTGNE